MNEQFVSTGTLPKPGLIGRLLRFGLGASLLFTLVPGLFKALPAFSSSTKVPTSIGLWFASALAFSSCRMW